MDKKRQQQAYENYVKQKTPVHNLPANMTKAFVTGGAICVLGQGILNICEKAGLDKDISGGWCSMLLVFLSAVLTGFNVYPRIAKWGGAGALVPIAGAATELANPVIGTSAPAPPQFASDGYRLSPVKITDNKINRILHQLPDISLSSPRLLQIFKMNCPMQQMLPPITNAFAIFAARLCFGVMDST